MENQESFGMESRTVKEASVEGVQRRTKPKKHFVSLYFKFSCVLWRNVRKGLASVSVRCLTCKRAIHCLNINTVKIQVFW